MRWFSGMGQYQRLLLTVTTRGNEKVVQYKAFGFQPSIRSSKKRIALQRNALWAIKGDINNHTPF
jgi:hypothetical protein